MAEISAAQGAQGASAASGSATPPQNARKKEKAPNSVMNNGAGNANQAPKEPQRKEITVTAVPGTSLFGLAMKYDVSVDDIKKLNGLTSDNIREGQKIRIMAFDPKEKEAWDNYQDELSEQKYEAERKADIERKNKLAESRIEEAIEYGLDDKYSFSIQKETGNIIITLKEGRQLYDVKQDFNIPDGVLRAYNNDLNKYEIPKFDTERGMVENADNVKAKKGDTLVIDIDSFKPDKPFMQKLADVWNWLWN